MNQKKLNSFILNTTYKKYIGQICPISCTVLSYIFCIFFVGFSNLSFAQEYPKKVIIGKDTCIIFNLEQSKKLISWDVDLEQCKSENIVLIKESSLKDSIIVLNKEMAQKYSEILVINDLIQIEKNELIAVYIKEKKLYEKQIKKHKRQKLFSISLGVITTSILTTLILIK